MVIFTMVLFRDLTLKFDFENIVQKNQPYPICFYRKYCVSEHLRMAHLLAAVSSPPVSFRPAGGSSLLLTSKTQAIRALSLEEIPPNAVRRKLDSTWRGGFSLGVDLGLSRTGLALSKGYSFRPLTVTQFHLQTSYTPTFICWNFDLVDFQVLELRGQKLELRIIDIAQKQVYFFFTFNVQFLW